MKLTARLHKPIEDNRRAVIADGHPFTVDAIGGAEHLLFEGSSQPGDEGLILGAPDRHGADPHGHQWFAAVLASGKPFPEAVTRVVREATSRR
jgi:hypothetical protein